MAYKEGTIKEVFKADDINRVKYYQPDEKFDSVEFHPCGYGYVSNEWYKKVNGKWVLIAEVKRYSSNNK